MFLKKRKNTAEPRFADDSAHYSALLSPAWTSPPMENVMGRFAIGQSVPRTEDDRLTAGRDKFLDDFTLLHQSHAIFLRWA